MQYLVAWHVNYSTQSPSRTILNATGEACEDLLQLVENVMPGEWVHIGGSIRSQVNGTAVTVISDSEDSVYFYCFC